MCRWLFCLFMNKQLPGWCVASTLLNTGVKCLALKIMTKSQKKHRNTRKYRHGKRFVVGRAISVVHHSRHHSAPPATDQITTGRACVAQEKAMLLQLHNTTHRFCSPRKKRTPLSSCINKLIMNEVADSPGYPVRDVSVEPTEEQVMPLSLTMTFSYDLISSRHDHFTSAFWLLL